MSPPRRSAESTVELRKRLVEHALSVIEREGADALTMRSLATEADCSVGLVYKVFTDRRELVEAILERELAELVELLDRLMDRAGRYTVGANLAWFANQFIASPAAPLVREAAATEQDSGSPPESHHGMEGLEAAVGRYLSAEQERSRVRPDVDTEAIGALVAAAVHNLVLAGAGWPRPSEALLRRRMDGLADAISP